MLFRSLGVALAAASAAAFAPLSDGPSPYNSSELSTIHNLFLANINVDGSGAVVAAPSKTHPNYYFHWVRDAAISMDVLYRYGGNYAANKAQIDAYVGWVSRAQAAPDPNPNQLLEGEPKYILVLVVSSLVSSPSVCPQLSFLLSFLLPLFALNQHSSPSVCPQPTLPPRRRRRRR